MPIALAQADSFTSPTCNQFEVARGKLTRFSKFDPMLGTGEHPDSNIGIVRADERRLGLHGNFGYGERRILLAPDGKYRALGAPPVRYGVAVEIWDPATRPPEFPRCRIRQHRKVAPPGLPPCVVQNCQFKFSVTVAMPRCGLDRLSTVGRRIDRLAG